MSNVSLACDVRWSRVRSRVVGQEYVWGVPNRGSREATLREGGVSAESAEPGAKAAKGNIVICKDVMYYCNISPESTPEVF